MLEMNTATALFWQKPSEEVIRHVFNIHSLVGPSYHIEF